MCNAPHDEIEYWGKIVPSENLKNASMVKYGKHTRQK